MCPILHIRFIKLQTALFFCKYQYSKLKHIFKQGETRKPRKKKTVYEGKNKNRIHFFQIIDYRTD